MSFKKFVEQNKLAVLIGLGSAGLLGLLYYLKNGGEHGSQEKIIDPTQKNVPLYDRVGGEQSVEALVSRFLDRLNSDKSLKRHTQSIKIKNHKATINQHVKQVFGGPLDDESLIKLDFKAIFADMGITDADFERADYHLEETFKELALVEKEINDAKNILASFKSQVVSVYAQK